ncbi:hypothetical protein MNB_SUP05-SYMBIONT-5-1167 [hydrothermal vent metagenome]|uniref:Uncharacterized protein n=1 Tax=hydrothermal vent metagenome TaxID=652676 RepID=A0A1W1E1V3_9ZZZZ
MTIIHIYTNISNLRLLNIEVLLKKYRKNFFIQRVKTPKGNQSP